MGNLTRYLQDAFAAGCPAGWRCSSEVPVLPAELESFLGYRSRADVLLERTDGSRRLWIEFEISRADPVANHAKFATAHLFRPQLPDDTFVAMVSSHVTRGRRNLASNTIHLMRHLGMNAFQTLLLPGFGPDEIKRINHLKLPSIEFENIPVSAEIERALAVSEPLLESPDRRIHMAGDLTEVMLNIRSWNEEMETDAGRALWNRRTVTYFVFDPVTRNFAPSKFCAYTAIRKRPGETGKKRLSEMTLELYVTLEGTDARFDGARARTHLTNNLSMECLRVEDASHLSPVFEKWLDRHSENVSVHPRGPIYLLPSGNFH